MSNVRLHEFGWLLPSYEQTACPKISATLVGSRAENGPKS
jgi:hypothetical protein